MIGDAGKISVFPTPGSDPNAFKAYYVNKDPVNSSGSALIHSHDDILYFPNDKKQKFGASIPWEIKNGRTAKMIAGSGLESGTNWVIL